MKVSERAKRHIDDSRELAELLPEAGRDIVGNLLNGKSFRGLAKLSGLSPTYLSQVNKGKSVISVGAYVKLVQIKKDQTQ